jgi:hypothetical protein
MSRGGKKSKNGPSNSSPTGRRDIDKVRDSGKSASIGTDGDDSAISEMIPIGHTLYFVKERGIYAFQMADQIDPGRTNISIPDIQQRILQVGSDDAVVARILLTAATLFNKNVLDSELGSCIPHRKLRKYTNQENRSDVWEGLDKS